jgi:hypothetical protein
MLRRGKGFPRIPGWAALVALCLSVCAQSQASTAAKAGPGDRAAHRMTGRLPGKPAYLWLWYSDGSPLPEDTLSSCSGLRPTAFKCNYGATVEDCQRQVQAYLDVWYADFNLVFTLTRPPSGDYYAMMITSEGTWCQQASTTEAGVAPFNCNDNPGQSAFAFECGYNAHACATLIAHEHGHMVGLEHTVSTTDVMNQTILSTATGFDDSSDRVLDDDYNICDLQNQNSYRVMLAALGTWPGGSKPAPLAALPDAGAPDLRPDERSDAPSGGGSVGPNPAAGDSDGGVIFVQGFDAPGLARPPLSTEDAAGVGTSGSRGGCNLMDTPAGASAPVAILLLMLALLTRQRRLHTRLRWSAARARRTASRRP